MSSTVSIANNVSMAALHWLVFMGLAPDPAQSRNLALRSSKLIGFSGVPGVWPA